MDGIGKDIRAAMPTIPDFTSLAWQAAHPEVEIAHRIMDGNGKMPAFRTVTQDQNLAVAIYVRSSLELAKAAPLQPGQEPPKGPPRRPS